MTTSAQDTPFSYDPFSRAAMEDPYPFYKVLRRDYPMYYMEQYDAYALSRFDDITKFLSYTDNRFMTIEGSLPTPKALRRKNNGVAPRLPGDDPFPAAQALGQPALGEVRRAHITPMMPRELKKLEGFIRDIANERLDDLLPTGKFNLTKEYGGIVSTSVIMHLMGMPLDMAREALEIVNAGTRTDPETGGFDSTAVAMNSMKFFLPYVQKRFDKGADGSVPMVDGLINYRYKGRSLNPVEVASNLICAFTGGTETVPKIVAHGLMELAHHPEQLAEVRSDLEKNVPKATEEMIRYCAPAQWFMRTAMERTEVADKTIEPGQRVFYLVASGLRDEREFEKPDEFQWNRSITRTLAFGQGLHFCIGAHLARLEIRVMVDAFLRRVEKFSFDMENAERPPSSFQRGWTTLPVIIE